MAEHHAAGPVVHKEEIHTSTLSPHVGATPMLRLCVRAGCPPWVPQLQRPA